MPTFCAYMSRVNGLQAGLSGIWVTVSRLLTSTLASQHNVSALFWLLHECKRDQELLSSRGTCGLMAECMVSGLLGAVQNSACVDTFSTEPCVMPKLEVLMLSKDALQHLKFLR